MTSASRDRASPTGDVRPFVQLTRAGLEASYDNLLREALADGKQKTAGMASALGWILGHGAGPVTGRDEYPITDPMILAESATAKWIAADGGPVEFGPAKIALLDAPFWPPLGVSPEWASGASATLDWVIATYLSPVVLEGPISG